MKSRGTTKSATAFRTISEVSSDLDVPQHVLRFWEGKFPQLRPLKRGGGRRYYRPEDVDLLRQIQNLLYGEGYTIKGVQRLLKDGKVDDDPDARRVAETPEEPDGPDTFEAVPDEAAVALLDGDEGAPVVALDGLSDTIRQAIAQALDELKEARLLLAVGEEKEIREV
ncbi:MerR family transcriptional regulator [Azospirillum formosense]|uniref:MerR family transcriptional regulator n=1 Tax=Azospirillum formosense TaxID=861533 RepID=A0ABX2L0N2_9PROT|nr:MerR family transcriptional regulator [Azospirillum formosense]MBY3753160.1 MerR family transcriptional regulator [Azospirillum formosense]NUB20060.1 MerR family transcriptional regulator [Azospirillum formosense]